MKYVLILYAIGERTLINVINDNDGDCVSQAASVQNINLAEILLQKYIESGICKK